MKKFGFKELTDLKVNTEGYMEGKRSEVRFLHPTKASGEPAPELTATTCVHHGVCAPVHMHVRAHRTKT